MAKVHKNRVHKNRLLLYHEEFTEPTSIISGWLRPKDPMYSVPNGATSRRLQLPYELAYGLQKLERLVVHIVKRIRHQEEDYLALHSSAADVSPAVAKLWASTWHQAKAHHG